MKAWADRVTAAKYLALLVALLLVLVADPALRGAPGLAWVVRGAVIVAGVVVFADRPVRRTAWLVGVPARLVVGGEPGERAGEGEREPLVDVPNAVPNRR